MKKIIALCLIIVSTLAFGLSVFAIFSHRAEIIGSGNVPSYTNDSISVYFGANEVANGMIVCDGGEKPLTNPDPDTNYLEDLNLVVSFIPVMKSKVRVKIKDQWVLTRYYQTGHIQTYIDTKLSECPWHLNPNWVYDVDSGYAYYQLDVDKSETLVTLNPLTGSDTYSISTSSFYREVVEVTIDFELEICQANRAEALWGTIPF